MGRSQGRALVSRLWQKGFWNMVRGQDPASKAVGPVSPNDLLTDWAAQPSIRCEELGRSPGSCLGRISCTRGRIQWDSGGRVVKLLYSVLEREREPSHPLLSLSSRSSFLRLPETDALVRIVGHHLHQHPQGWHLPGGVGESRLLMPTPLSAFIPDLTSPQKAATKFGPSWLCFNFRG